MLSSWYTSKQEVILPSFLTLFIPLNAILLYRLLSPSLINLIGWTLAIKRPFNILLVILNIGYGLSQLIILFFLRISLRLLLECFKINDLIVYKGLWEISLPLHRHFLLFLNWLVHIDPVCQLEYARLQVHNTGVHIDVVGIIVKPTT